MKKFLYVLVVGVSASLLTGCAGSEFGDRNQKYHILD